MNQMVMNGIYTPSGIGIGAFFGLELITIWIELLIFFICCDLFKIDLTFNQILGMIVLINIGSMLFGLLIWSMLGWL